MIALTRKPTKEEIRAWLKQQIAAKKPPATPEQIRTELGWNFELTNKSADCAR